MNTEKIGNRNIPKDFISLSQEWLQLRSYRIKRSTLIKYDYLLQLHVNRYFNGICVKDIDTVLINNKMMEVYNDNKDKLSYSTLKSIFYLIRAITSYGVSMGYYSQIYFNFEIVDHSIRQAVQVLSERQEKKIIQNILVNQSANHLGVALSLCTGLRLGEVCALSVDDIDFKKGEISVKRTVQRLSDQENRYTMLNISEPKSIHSCRTIPLSDFLYNILTVYQVRELDKGTYILTKSKSPYEPRTLQYGFKRIAKSCGYHDLHFHCLRHTFATKCVNSGFDIKTVSEILGHSSVAFTLNRYVHPSMEVKKKQMKLLDQSWNKFTVCLDSK